MQLWGGGRQGTKNCPETTFPHILLAVLNKHCLWPLCCRMKPNAMEQAPSNFVNFCALHNEVIWHGLGPSYLPASQAQEFLSRVLASPNKVMKCMKAQCSGLAAYIISLDPPGAWTLINISSPEKENFVHLYCMRPLGCMRIRKSIQGKKTISGGCILSLLNPLLHLYFLCPKWLSLLLCHAAREKSWRRKS